MSIAEFIRQHTLNVRDAIAALEEQIVRAEGQRNAADERVKRSSTEITRQRALETERKRSVNSASEKVTEAQRVLEEIDRRRQQALEVLIRCQDEQKDVEKTLANAQRATGAALSEIRREQTAQQEAEELLVRVRAEIKEQGAVYRHSLLKALEVYVDQQIQQVHASFDSREQQMKVLRDFEIFKRARHEDPEIGGLCDQRDELRKLLNTAMVPGVRAMLQTSLTEIETKLVKRYPVALQIPHAADQDNRIEEMLFYCDRNGKAIFFLPIKEADWLAAANQDIYAQTSEAMCLVWTMIRELNLRTEDGDFAVVNGRPAFASRFDLEEVAILQGFSVKCENQVVLRFVLSSVPAEVQEALSHEG